MKIEHVIVAIPAAWAALAGAAAHAQSTDPSKAVETPYAVSPAASADAPVPAVEEPVDAAPPANSRDQEAGSLIEEVIVTAQRREQSAQDVPISITVLDPQQLSNANIANASDLATYTPSLSTNSRFGPESATFAIRGFTQELRTTASVATYFAEVVAPRGNSAQSSGDGAGPGMLFDLQNVQVLKGPQGTLFGRNTTGGAVLLVPKMPTEQYEGYAEVSVGDYGMRRIQAVANLPLAESFRLRAGVEDSRRDGYLNNVTGIGADEFGNLDYTSARLSALWDITETIDNYTILTYVESENNGYTSQLFACNPDPTLSFYAFIGAACQQQLANQAASGRNGYYDLASTVAKPHSLIEEKRAINTTTWQVSDSLRLKNILAYGHLTTENESDISGYQFDMALDPDPRREFEVGNSIKSPGIPVTSQATWVEELQLQGTAFGGDLEWQAGAYYEQSRPDGPSGNTAPLLISCDVATLRGDPSQFNCFDLTRGQLGSVLRAEYSTKYLNQALYAEGTYAFTERVSMTLGLRYTWDETEGHSFKQRYVFANPAQSTATSTIETESQARVTSEAPTGQIQIAYKPLRDVMTYAKFVRGYRQGSVVLPADAGIDTYDAEHVNTYEIGAKTAFRGAVPGRFNIAAFYNDLTDQQLQSGYVSPTAGPTTAIFNAGKSRIAGVEAEAFIQLLPDLTFGLSYSFLDTELLEQQDRRADVLAAGGPFAGNTYQPAARVGDELPFAPRNTYVASLTYTLPLPSEIGAIDVGATYVSIDERRASASGTSPFAVLDAYELLNLNIAWTGILGTPLDLSVFGTNVLDEEYVSYISGSYNSIGTDSRQLGIPRMIGARLKYSFGRS